MLPPGAEEHGHLRRPGITGDVKGLIMAMFVARQPILDRAERVYGYDLRFRPGSESTWSTAGSAARENGNSLPNQQVDEFSAFIDGTQAFISYTPEAFMEDHPSELPRDKIVLGIPGIADPSPELVDACRRLKESGYTLALENFPPTGDSPLLEFAKVIRMDVTASADRAQWLLMRKLRPSGIIFIADKVDSRAQFQNAIQQGYSYFQRQFFLRPQANTGSDVTPTKLVYLLILGEVTRSEINIDEVARMIKHDLALSYKLLRLLNSARFAFHTQVKSIRHALLLLGEIELRKWIGLISVAAMGEGGPPLLVTMALVRAAFCESIAPPCG
jgi:c-di-GMP-related signal transduction protein